MNWMVSVIIIALLFLNKFIYVHVKRVHRGAVGGIPSEPDEFPFMTALGWTNNDTGEVNFLCGGVLITQNFVLTAAHCLFFEGQLPSIIKIGGNDLNCTDNEDHSVEAYFMFPEYKSIHAYDDIAMLKLKKNSRKRPASLWVGPNLEFMNVVAIGYGTIQYAGSRTSILQKVNLIVMREAECEPHSRREKKFPKGIANSHICAGDPDGKQDTCQGDSGGPLLVQNKFAAGITSSGRACGGSPPSVYTRIATYLDWIAGILKVNGYKRVYKSLNINKI